MCREWAKEEGLTASFETAAITTDPFSDVTFDAAVAAMILDNVSRDEMDQAISILHQKLRSGGVLFALFNPFLTDKQKEEIFTNSQNPTKDITSVTYSDEEIQSAFPGFEVIHFKKYPLQGFEFRGLSLRKK